MKPNKQARIGVLLGVLVFCALASLGFQANQNNFGGNNGVIATQTVASGSSALATGAINNGACASAVTTAATGTLTTDIIAADFNGDPSGVTGYNPAAAAQALTIFKYPTSGNVNFKVCNFTAAPITPGAITLNWRVVR